MSSHAIGTPLDKKASNLEDFDVKIPADEGTPADDADVNPKESPKGDDLEPTEMASEFMGEAPLDARIRREYEMYDSINQPKHYTWLPSGIETFDVSEHFNSNVGQAIQYIVRHPVKGTPEEDLRKAVVFLNREIERGLKHGFMEVNK